ncbi:hypothetical protein ACA910_021834 [Epithemia clementina (nom. ined.)]
MLFSVIAVTLVLVVSVPTEAVFAAAEFSRRNNNTSAKTETRQHLRRQPAAPAAASSQHGYEMPLSSSDEQQAPEWVAQDRKLSSISGTAAAAAAVDPKVVERFQKVPPGFRKHPSYYSEKYLPRARDCSAAEQAQLDTKWGKWEYVDSKASTRPGHELYDSFPHRDVPRASFPANAWQTDTDHLSQFLPEAIRLTDRALEAILSEYGHGQEDMPGKTLEERSLVFEPFLDGVEPPQGKGGGGSMPTQSFHGLQRRVLHAVMTEDRFTVAMAGHSAAAGHGNHFQQTYTLQIQRILEPIFARLGVIMSARNFGMGGLGTLHNTIASGDIYGQDVDILLWDSGMTEKEKEARGIMAIQGLVGMDRAPFLWFERERDQILTTIHNRTGADVAVYGDPAVLKLPVQSAEELEKLPWALQYLDCPSVMKEYCGTLRYNGTCWRDRSNFQWQGMDLSYTPTIEQLPVPGGRAGWHPGNREHQIVARLFTFTILWALRDGLKMWYETPDYAIRDDAWHVTNYYAAIKSKVVENKDTWVAWCSTKKISVKFCLYGAKGRTENTPRNRPWATSLRAIMAGSEHSNIQMGTNLYDPPDVYIRELDPPDGQVDVLAIVENGVDFPVNLVRVTDSAQDMQGRDFSQLGEQEGKGSKHKPSIITGGKGWQLGGTPDDSAGTDNCDGEHDSWCHRVGPCLTYGHNDQRTGLVFDGFSGWLIFNLPKVEHGVIMIKLHTWWFEPPSLTEGWCSENNAEDCQSRALSSLTTTALLYTNNTTTSSPQRQEQPQQQQRQRSLKQSVPSYCDGFAFQFAIDGGDITTWDKSQFTSNINQAQRVAEFVTLLDDDTWETPKENVELAFRIRGCGRQKPLELTHIYWI